MWQSDPYWKCRWPSEHTGRFWKRQLSKGRRRFWKNYLRTGRWKRYPTGTETECNYKTW